MLDRSDLPLRDVVRIFVPGVYGVILICWIDLATFGETVLADTHFWSLAAFGILLSLIAFASEVHTWVPPWRTIWHTQIASIRDEIRAITGARLAEKELSSRAIYKLWIEAACAPEVRTHIHYLTGLFYCFVACSILSAFGAAWTLAHAITRWTSLPYHNPRATLVDSRAWILSSSCIFMVAVTFTFYRFSKKCLKDAIYQGRVTLQRDGSRPVLEELAEAAARVVVQHDIAQIIQKAVSDAACKILPSDIIIEAVNWTNIVEQFDVRRETKQRILPIGVKCTEPSRANGRENMYSGYLQQRLESEVCRQVADRIGVHDVRLQILPIQTGGRTRRRFSDLEFLDPDEAVRRQIILSGGNVHRACQEYGLPNLLVYHGFVLGPSLGLIAVLRDLVQSRRVKHVFDPFCGTDVARKVVNKVLLGGARVTSGDKHGQFGTQKHDAFSTPIPADCDLVVIDPFYEDLFTYLAFLRGQLKGHTLIVQSGDLKDDYWNAAAQAYLQDTLNCTILSTPNMAKSWGSNIIVAKAA